MMNIKSISIQADTSLIDALKRMDQVGHKMLLVFCGEKFYSILTIGELQRAIIANLSMETPVISLINVGDKTYVYVGDDFQLIRRKMLGMRCEYMPVLDGNGDIIEIYSWSDIFHADDISFARERIDLPVVIMAGGTGTRLKPLTNVIPKPLIPIGDRTILEAIMDQFENVGCGKFYISVNYKADMVRSYLSQLDHKYDVEYLMESIPMGTIGSVSLLKGKITTPFFVSNCDSINEQDYRDVYNYHVSNHNDMTVVAMIKSFKIPYGVIETCKDGLMKSLQEKPEQTYMVNSGVYILNPDLIAEIPEGKFFHITDLMEKVRAHGGRVGCFPISENAWHDMGEWPEYLRMIGVK